VTQTCDTCGADEGVSAYSVGFLRLALCPACAAKAGLSRVCPYCGDVVRDAAAHRLCYLVGEEE